MLGRLGLSVPECIEEYQKLSTTVFTKRRHRMNRKAQIQGRFDHEALEEGIKDLLRRRGLSEDELLKDSSQETRCKTFVCSISQQTSHVVLFPSYYSKTWGSQMLNRVRIWEAARATSAATSFFEPLTIDGKVFADGATGANNPIFELWAEASSVFKTDDRWRLEDHLKCLISIGTGIPSLKQFGPGITDVVGALKAIATESESKSDLFQRQYSSLVRESTFFRFNVTHGLEDVGLEEADRLGDIESSTYRYCASPLVVQQIDKCAGTLKRTSWISEAIARFKTRIESPLLMSLYEMESRTLPSTEVNRFVHTKAFQEWLAGDRKIIICTTTRQIENTTCALGACISKYVTEQANHQLLYVDCYWILQTPSQAKQKTLGSISLKSELKHMSPSKDESVRLVLEFIYSQLFRMCAHKQEILEEYNRDLTATDSVLFKSQISKNGVPQGKHVWSLIESLMDSATTRILICLDRVDELEEQSRARIMDLFSSSLPVQTAPRILMCGRDGVIGQDNIFGTPVVSEETEAKECLASLSFPEMNVRKSQVSPAADGTTQWIWRHPTYLEFVAENSGVLWIRGKPGSGKSVLARSIQRRLLYAPLTSDGQGNQPLVGDWFYHRRRGGGYVRHESFVRSVLIHLLEQRSALFDEFFRDTYGAMDPRIAAQWTYDTLVAILESICRSVIPLICIIDAVDESESAEVMSLIHSLIGSDGRSRSRFIVLSRPNVQIERHVEGAPAIVVEDENASDIERIIDLALSSLKKALHSLDFRQSALSNRKPKRSLIRQPRVRTLATTAAREKQAMGEIRQTLVSKSQGSILWVKLLIDKLIHEAENNDGTTIEEMRLIVERVPEELSDYYWQIAEELMNGKSPDRVRDIRQALMWICCAPEIGEVTLEGLWEAFALLKDDMRSDKLDLIWEKQIPARSYEELWRKIFSVCGPFIEIFNPGLSAEESRLYHYGPSSIIQLMHQSVRDFLCNPKKSLALSFTLDEARQLVRKRLEHYLSLTISDHHIMRREKYQDLQLLVNWLNDQKLLQLAVEADRARLDTTRKDLRATRRWRFEDPPPQTPEIILMNAVSDGSSASRLEFMEIGRIFYHCHMQGLITAVRNIVALGWVTAEEAASELGVVILYSAILVSSISGSVKVGASLNLYARTTAEATRNITNILDQSSSGVNQSSRRSSSDDPDSEDTRWVSCPWTVVLKTNKGETPRELSITFSRWASFLDVICGSKRFVVEQNDHMDGESDQGDQMMGPIEDVEDAIIETMSILERLVQ